MNWIFQSILGLVLDFVSTCLDVISKEFYEVLKLNGANTLDLFFNLFMPNVKSGGINVWGLSVGLGLVILYFNLILGLFKAFFGSLTKAESPLKLVAKFLFFALFTANAKSICVLFFDIGTAPYSLLKSMDFSGAPDLGAALKTFATTKIVTSFSVSGAFAECIKSIFTIFILFSILVNYLKLIIEVAERYVILGVLSMVSPMCIATGASESTANIAKSWVRMMVSQVIVMCMSVFFLKVFEGAVGRISTAGASPFLAMVLILAWLRTGQRIDSHMGTLGLTVAQAGNGLYGDMMAGAAVAKSVGRKAAKGINMGVGIAAAGGGRAWAASKEGERMLGTGASRIARAAQSIGPHGAQSKINTAKFDAMNSGIGVNRGQSAINGVQAKYGDAKVKNADGSEGKSLNDLLAEGGSIKSAAMAADGSGEATVIDKDGNELSMMFNDTNNGDPVVGLQGNEEALNNAMGTEAEGDMNANDVMAAVGGEEQASSQLSADGDCVMDENNNIVAGGVAAEDLSGMQTADGQDVTGLADESGMVAAGTAITDEDGNTIGVADGNGNMATDGTYAVDADGNLQEVSGIAGINADGQAIDANGAVLNDANGEAIQMADVGAAGSVGINESGQFVDSNNNVVGDSAATSGIAIADNGNVFAKGEDGQYHAMTDENGNAVKLNEGDSLGVNSDGNLSSVNSGSDSVGISSTMSADGNNVNMSDSATNISNSVDGGVGNMAVNDAGAMVGISNAIGNDGQISAGAVESDASGSFINADDGSRVAVTDNGNGSYSVSGGTFKEANGFIATNTKNEKGSASMAAVSGGSISGGVSSALGSNVATYDHGGKSGNNFAMTASGMVALGSNVNANGQVTSGSVQHQNGKAYMDVNGSQVALSKDSSSPTGYKVSGGTFSKAEGNKGSYAVGTSASGSSMLVQTNNNGGINRYSQTQSGQIALSGNSSAISHSYSSASGGSGSHVKDKHGNFKEVYSGSGGKGSGGAPIRYSPDGNGGYKQDSNGQFVRTTANNSSGYNYTNTGDNAGKTYNQTGSHYNGINVSKNSDGSYGINLSKNASAHSYGNGIIDVNTGKGGSVRLMDAAMYAEPAGAMKTTFNGKSYYAVSNTSAATGHIGGQNKAEEGKRAQSLVSSCNDGTVRDFFQGKYKNEKGTVSNAAATSVIDHKNGSFTIASSRAAGKDKQTGQTNSYKAMTFYPADQFQTNNPDAKRVSFKGKEYIAVESRQNKSNNSISTAKGAGISTRKDMPDPSQFGSFKLRTEINYVNKGMAGSRTARQKKIDNMDRQEGRR